MTVLEKQQLSEYADNVWAAIGKVCGPTFERGTEAYVICLNANTAIREALLIIDNAIKHSNQERATNCCSSDMIPETDICGKCGEHSALIEII